MKGNFHFTYPLALDKLRVKLQGGGIMGKLGEITFTGKSGGEYDFVAYSLDTTHKNVGAVYIFTKRTKNNDKWNHDALYIGQTDILADRLSGHEKWDCLENNDVNCLCTHADNDETSRLNKETNLRQAYKTPCNEQ